MKKIRAIKDITSKENKINGIRNVFILKNKNKKLEMR